MKNEIIRPNLIFQFEILFFSDNLFFYSFDILNIVDKIR